MKWLDRTLVTAPLHYGLCVTEKSFLRELKRLKISPAPNWVLNEHSSATTHFFERKEEGRITGVIAIVCVRDFKGRSVEQVHRLLVHEATHIWQQIKILLGESFPGEEFEAYSLQNISQNLMEAFKEEVKRK